MAVRTPGLKLNTQIAFVRAWDGQCDQCGLEVALDEDYWTWTFPVKSVYMHVACFLAWSGQLDAEASRVRLSE